MSLEHHKTKEDNLVLDPCARGITGWKTYIRNPKDRPTENYRHFLKGVVTNRDNFDFKSHPRPKHAWNKTIIYELHVGGFTKHPDSTITDSKKGTFLGLIDKIPYLKSIGIRQYYLKRKEKFSWKLEYLIFDEGAEYNDVLIVKLYLQNHYKDLNLLYSEVHFFYY